MYESSTEEKRTEKLKNFLRTILTGAAVGASAGGVIGLALWKPRKNYYLSNYPDLLTKPDKLKSVLIKATLSDIAAGGIAGAGLAGLNYIFGGKWAS